MKRRTLIAGGAASALGGTAIFFDDLAALARADARRSASLDVTPNVLSPDAPTATATLRNNALVPIRVNPAAWRVVHDGDHVVPDGRVMPLAELMPGDTITYTVRLGGQPTDIAKLDGDVQLGEVDSGQYAFRVEVGVGERTRTVDAPFRVERDAT